MVQSIVDSESCPPLNSLILCTRLCFSFWTGSTGDWFQCSWAPFPYQGLPQRISLCYALAIVVTLCCCLRFVCVLKYNMDSQSGFHDDNKVPSRGQDFITLGTQAFKTKAPGQLSKDNSVPALVGRWWKRQHLKVVLFWPNQAPWSGLLPDGKDTKASAECDKWFEHEMCSVLEVAPAPLW